MIAELTNSFSGEADILKRILLGLAGLAVIGAVVWLVLDQTGWSEIDKPPLVASRILDERFATVQQEADRLLAAAYETTGAVGLTAAVSIDGKPVWTGAIGWADLAQRKPADANTVFRIGSTSKAVTATLAARLLDAGRITLDDPVSRWSADLPEHWRALTIHQLLSHTAGMPDYDQNGDLLGLYQTIVLDKRYTDVRDALDLFDGSSLIATPGEHYKYTSLDVNLASVVLQDSAGAPYQDILKRDVLAPLGMTATAPDGLHPSPDDIAVFYDKRGSLAKPWGYVDLSQKWASGGLLSTSADLTRLCGGWFDPGFIRPETVETFWTQQRLKSGEVNEQGYALGWRARPASDALGKDLLADRFHHGGVSRGSMSWLVCHPEHRLGVAININSRAEEFELLSSSEPALTRLFIDAMKAQTPQN